jgi:hypothetical protein
MIVRHQAIKIKELCESKKGNELIIELCKIVHDLHSKGKAVGFEDGIEACKNALGKINN